MSVSSIGVPPVSVEETRDGQLVAVVGRIDVRTVPDLRQILHQIVDTGSGDVLLALENAEIGDATGLGMLVECYRRARRQARQVAIVSMTPRTERLLRTARLDRALVRQRPLTVAPLTA